MGLIEITVSICLNMHTNQCLRTLFNAISATRYSYANPKVPVMRYCMQVAIAMLTTLAHDDKWGAAGSPYLHGSLRVELAELLVQR